uniref:Uncharacterized protein n=1 Tax=Arundo donax TaxID=35708 RepID=A0A0A9E330_ARUDO
MVQVSILDVSKAQGMRRADPVSGIILFMGGPGVQIGFHRIQLLLLTAVCSGTVMMIRH